MDKSIEDNNNELLLFLSKIEWEKFDILLGKWLDYYFNKQNIYHNIDTYRILIKSQIKKYVSGMKSDIYSGKVQYEEEWLLIEREFHELIYDWVNDPWIEYIENEKKLEKQDRLKNLKSAVSKSLYTLFDRK